MIFELILPYLDIIIAIVILVLFCILAKGIDFGLKKYITRLTAKTDTILDDIMVKAFGRFIFLGIILVGIYLASKTLLVLQPYMSLVNSGFTVIFILFGAFLAIRILNGLLEWYAKELALKRKTKVDEQFLSVTKKVIYLVIFAIALIWMLNQLGIQITTLVATLGIGGLAIALALQPTLSNFFAGTYLIMDKPIKIGDYIEIDTGERGYVQDIGWRSTKIRIKGNNLVIIPNSKLSESRITNYCFPQKEVTFAVGCGVGYGEDLEKVERVTVKAAKKVLKKVEGGISDYEPVFRFKEFGDSNINFYVVLRVKKYVDKFKLRHEFIKAIKKAFDKERIEISWPVRKVYMKK